MIKKVNFISCAFYDQFFLKSHTKKKKKKECVCKDMLSSVSPMPEETIGNRKEKQK